MALRFSLPLFCAAVLVLAPAPGQAAAQLQFADMLRMQPELQCVPYARYLSGVQIYGDAHTWWKQAEGRYQRGSKPRVGAVMAFRPHGNMRLGHVAAVSKIIDARTVLVSHSNWSPIGGRRGQIENDVRVIDVSEANDWSRVRVWFAPLGAMGGGQYPLHGFIYAPDNSAQTRIAEARKRLPPRSHLPATPVDSRPVQLAVATPKPRVAAVSAAPAPPRKSRLGRDFMAGVVAETSAVPVRGAAPVRSPVPARAAAPVRAATAARASTATASRADPIGDLIGRVTR